MPVHSKTVEILITCGKKRTIHSSFCYDIRLNQYYYYYFFLICQNWVRNRRRPSAAQKRQEIQEVSAHLASSSPLIQSPLTTLSNIPFSTNITTVTLPTQNHTPHTPPILTIPEPKRVCFDNATSILNNDSG